MSLHDTHDDVLSDADLDKRLETLAQNVNVRLAEEGAPVRMKVGVAREDKISMAVMPNGQLVQIQKPEVKVAVDTSGFVDAVSKLQQALGQAAWTAPRANFEHAIEYIVKQSGTPLDKLHQSIQDIVRWGRWSFTALEVSEEKHLRATRKDVTRLEARVAMLERSEKALRGRCGELLKRWAKESGRAS